MARRFAVVISHAPGLSGTPDSGHRSSAATSASCARSSANPTSPVIRVSPAMTLADSIRQTASMARWVSVAVTATNHTIFDPRGKPRHIRRAGRWPVGGCPLSPQALVLRDARLDELPHQRRREGLVYRKLDRALGHLVLRKCLLVCFHEGGADAEQAAVILERGVVHQHPVMLERRDAVADELGRLGRGGLDRLAQLLEGGPRGGWHRPQVGGHRGEFFHGAKNSFNTGASAAAATVWG